MGLLRKLQSLFSSGKSTTASLNRDTLSSLEKIIGVSIRDEGIFAEALSHRSYLRANNLNAYQSYERLEFLGDGIVNMLVAEYLFILFPRQDEGFLTKLRARLVNTQNLAHLCRSTGLNNHILFGPDIDPSTVRENQGIQADIYESICAALYKQSGLEEVRRFVLDSLDRYVDVQEMSKTSVNYKSDLLELLQSRGKLQPIYRVVTESGPPHKRRFEVEVIVDEKACGSGRGKSKKNAEQKAAREALTRLVIG